MDKVPATEIIRPPVGRRYLAAALVWTLLVAVSVGNSLYQQSLEVEKSAMTAARANIAKDLNFRRWAASHGGVYVQPDTRTPPNPYLKVPKRDVVTSDGMALTLMNPAYMLRQMQSEYMGEFGAQSRITSLKPMNPGNAPKEWERQALTGFEQGEAEYREIVERDDKRYLRLMLPIVAEQACLQCHADQGYRLGDIRGGISSVVPLESFEAQGAETHLAILASHGMLWLVGLCGFGLGYRQDRGLEDARLDAEQDMQRYREIVETSDDLLAFLDREQRYQVVNSAYAKVYGSIPEALVGRHVRDVMGGAFYESVAPYITRTLEGGSARFRETQTFSDGQQHMLDVAYRPYRLHGRVEGLVASLRDVTEQWKAEQALTLSEAKFRSYLADAPIPILVADSDGLIMEANPAAGRLLGIPRNELAGHRLTEFYLPNDRESPHWDKENLLSGSLVEGENRVLRRGGGAAWVMWRVVGIEAGCSLVFLVEISARKAAERSLMEREIELRTIVETDPECIKVINSDGTLRQMNPAGLAMVEADGAEQVLGRPISGIVVPECRDAFMALHERVMKGESGTLQFEIKGLKGTRRWLETQAVPMRNGTGEVTAILGVTRDITERRRNEEGLRLAAVAFGSVTDGIVVTDPNGIIVDVNASFEGLTGYSREELVGSNPRMLHSGMQDAEFYRTMWHALLTQHVWVGEFHNRRKDGSVYVQYSRITAVHDANGRLTHYVGISSDITELRHSQQRLEHLAYHDLLTHLPNRVLLGDRMRQAMALADRKKELLAVCYLDLDGFKPINDTWGHEAGDQLLIETAERLRQCVRGADTVSRLGGDEFVILLGEMTEVDEVGQALHRILDTLNRPYPLPHGEVVISASLGVTLYPLDGDDADVLIRHADQAMYAAKQAGKSCFRLFDPEHDRASRNQQEQIKRFSSALENGELRLHYQPKVDMRSGRMIGAEALLRWQHPEQGLLVPGQFLSALESADLALPLGEWVLGEALGQMASWEAQGLLINISVNISSQHLQQRDFVGRLRHLLTAHPRVAPSQLTLEILETSAVEDMAQVSQVIQACRALGVSFALDDFGTGYSSLTYLRQLPTEELKIDQSFVRDMLKDRDDRAIVEGVISLAHTFGRQAIAEGVETLEHGVLLLQLGCHLAQGYAIAHPMPAEQLLAWQNSWMLPDEWARAAKASA